MSLGNYILIVDPDAELVSLMERVLRETGYDTRSARDGEEAYKLCEQQLPKILVLEGLTPKLNGIELAKKARALPEGGLVSILLTGTVYAGAKFRPEIEEAQIDEVLAKPFVTSDLMKMISRLEIRLEDRLGKIKEEPGPEPFTPQGSLTEMPFIRLVYYIFTGKMAGTLRLQHGDTKKLVTFQEGEPRFVVSNIERECLGQILVKKGRLSPEECEKSLQMMRQWKKKQGEALIQLGLLEPYELEDALKQQAREKFLEIFSWQEGQYLFVPGRVFRQELTPVDLNIPQLCLRGVKEYYNLPRLQAALGDYLSLPVTLNQESLIPIESFKFATWDMRIVQQLKRKKSITDAVEKRRGREVDIYHLYYTLHMLDVIRFPLEKADEKVLEKPKENEPEMASPFDILGVELGELALRGGAPTLQLRHKEASDRDLLKWAQLLRQLTRRYRATFIVNDRIDLALACEADGVHLGPHDFPAETARTLLGEERLIGVSVDTPEEARRAAEIGADYVGAGPVFPTASKPDTGAVIGLTGLTAIVGTVSLPVIGIGGIDQTNLLSVLQTGAHGAAVLSGVMAAANPEAAVRNLLKEMRDG